MTPRQTALFGQPENLSDSATKRDIRRVLRQARSRQPENARRAAALAANRTLSAFIKRGKRIAVYWAIGSELPLHRFVRTARKRGAHVYLPYIEPRSLRLWFTPYPVSGSLKAERHRGGGKIRVPQFRGRKIRAQHLHTMILPIVGIDRQGYRLGQGGGYYDCTVAHVSGSLKPRLVAAGYACQSIARLPNLPHDIRADYFVSERGVHRFPTQAETFAKPQL